jgi:hypothetical protein
MAEMRQKIKLVVRPTGVYHSLTFKGLDWLTTLFCRTGFRQSQPYLANSPMGDCRLHTGPNRQRNEVRCGS